MHTRTLGTNGPRVSALGLGCMGMSDLYRLAESQGAIDLDLTADDLARIEQAVPAEAVA